MQDKLPFMDLEGQTAPEFGWFYFNKKKKKDKTSAHTGWTLAVFPDNSLSTLSDRSNSPHKFDKRDSAYNISLFSFFKKKKKQITRILTNIANKARNSLASSPETENTGLENK